MPTYAALPSCRYLNSTVNDLGWWGLDYPPLSGYQVPRRLHVLRMACIPPSLAAVCSCASLCCPACPVLLPLYRTAGFVSAPTLQSWLAGKYVAAFEPEALALVSSRGYESPSSKMLLRQTVLAADAAVFVPAALAAAAVFGGATTGGAASGGGPRGWLAAQAAGPRLRVLAALLFSPAALLIDHGHFQYNCIGLGLALGGAAAAAAGCGALASLLYCLSLNHKQMGLYYGPAFFAFLLGRCLQRPTLAGKVWLGRREEGVLGEQAGRRPAAPVQCFPPPCLLLPMDVPPPAPPPTPGPCGGAAGRRRDCHLCRRVGALAGGAGRRAGRAAPRVPHPAGPLRGLRRKLVVRRQDCLASSTVVWCNRLPHAWPCRCVLCRRGPTHSPHTPSLLPPGAPPPASSSGPACWPSPAWWPSAAPPRWQPPRRPR